MKSTLMTVTYGREIEVMDKEKKTNIEGNLGSQDTEQTRVPLENESVLLPESLDSVEMKHTLME